MVVKERDQHNDLAYSDCFRVHIVAKQANRYIVAFHIAILRYCMISTYQQAAVKRCKLEGGHTSTY